MPELPALTGLRIHGHDDRESANTLRMRPAETRVAEVNGDGVRWPEQSRVTTSNHEVN